MRVNRLLIGNDVQFVPGGAAADGVRARESLQLRVTGAALHYLRAVLRLKPLDQVEVIDPSAPGRYRAQIIAVRSDEAELTVLSRQAPIAQPPLTLLLGVPKNATLDFIIEKGVEIGVTSFALFAAQRTQGAADKTEKRLQRLQRIIQTALKQCGRTVPIDCSCSDSLAAALKLVHGEHDLSQTGQWRLLFASDSEVSHRLLGANAAQGCASPEDIVALFLSGALGNRLAGFEAGNQFEKPERCVDSYIMIGPEGGLTPEELEQGRASGYCETSLGDVTLRVETAVVAACSIVSLLRRYGHTIPKALADALPKV